MSHPQTGAWTEYVSKGDWNARRCAMAALSWEINRPLGIVGYQEFGRVHHTALGACLRPYNAFLRRLENKDVKELDDAQKNRRNLAELSIVRAALQRVTVSSFDNAVFQLNVVTWHESSLGQAVRKSMITPGVSILDAEPLSKLDWEKLSLAEKWNTNLCHEKPGEVISLQSRCNSNDSIFQMIALKRGVDVVANTKYWEFSVENGQRLLGFPMNVFDATEVF
ncbi:hypothetical protein Tco_1371425 [Tanacetum coccineum]